MLASLTYNPAFVVTVVAGYVSLTAGLKSYMASRGAFQINPFFRPYALSLSFASLALLVFILREMWPMLLDATLSDALCHARFWTDVSLARFIYP